MRDEIAPRVSSTRDEIESRNSSTRDVIRSTYKVKIERLACPLRFIDSLVFHIIADKIVGTDSCIWSVKDNCDFEIQVMEGVSETVFLEIYDPKGTRTPLKEIPLWIRPTKIIEDRYNINYEPSIFSKCEIMVRLELIEDPDS